MQMNAAEVKTWEARVDMFRPERAPATQLISQFLNNSNSFKSLVKPPNKAIDQIRQPVCKQTLATHKFECSRPTSSGV